MRFHLEHEIVHRIKAVLDTWEVLRVDVAKTPKANRFAQDVPATHRATILQFSDQTLYIDAQDFKTLNLQSVTRIDDERTHEDLYFQNSRGE